MLKKFFLLAISIASMAPAVFAGAEPTVVNKTVENAFRQQFGDITLVTWKKAKLGEVYIGQYLKDGLRKEAFFDLNGRLVGEGHYISTESVPAIIQKLISKEFKNYELIEAYEFYYNNSYVPVYGLAVQNDKETLQLKLNESGELSVVKRIK